ncbi:glutamate receptor-like [Liolophura sinensis]|uniref:glutamate receptor-like n=1 Tax=Liolophura sinensis TaxID=3198878 RepID=UPI0031581493
MVSAMTEDPCPSLTAEKFTLRLIPENNNVPAVLVDLVKAAGRKYIYLKFGNRVAGTTEYNLYTVPVGLYTEIRPMGNWTENKGLTVDWAWQHITKLFRSKLTDFGGVNLRIAVDKESHPYVNRSESGNNSYHGMMVDMLEDLAKELNFRYTFVEAGDGFYGAKRADGLWSGTVGLVVRGEADFGAVPFTVTKERSEAVDFTTPFQQESLSIIMAAPKETPNQFQFLKPFNFDVWLSLIAALLIASVGLVFISLKSPTQIQHEANILHVELERSVLENIFLIISSYFEQGPTFYPTSVSGRCLLSFWFVFTILTMAMYTAHLAAVLTVSTPVRPINSLQDLVDQSDLPVYCLTGTNTYTVLTMDRKRWINVDDVLAVVVASDSECDELSEDGAGEEVGRDTGDTGISLLPPNMASSDQDK